MCQFGVAQGVTQIEYVRLTVNVDATKIQTTILHRGNVSTESSPYHTGSAELPTGLSTI